MKKIRALLLTSLVLMSFVVTSISMVDDIFDNCELIENTGEEEEKSKEKEGEDNVKEFILYYQTEFLTDNTKKSLYFIHKKNFTYNIGEVLTPPPEFI